MTVKTKRFRTPAKWLDDYYLEAYLLARQGLPDSQIAKTLGVSPSTFKAWKEDRRALRRTLKRARKSDENSGSAISFSDYVYEQLPSRLQKVLDRINEYTEQSNAVEKIETLLQDEGLGARQHLFVHSLITNAFNISRACSQVNITTNTFRRWCNNDPDFHDLIVEMDWHKGNFFESALINLVKSGDSSAIIYANKTFNKKRGYGEKLEVDVSGTITHNHQLVDVDQLNLPLETRKQILIAYRENKADDKQNDES